MSSTDLLKLSIEKRREYQYKVIKQWAKGIITGRACIEEVLSLEHVIYLDDKVLKAYKEKYEGPESNSPANPIN